MKKQGTTENLNTVFNDLELATPKVHFSSNDTSKTLLGLNQEKGSELRFVSKSYEQKTPDFANLSKANL